MAIAKQTVVLKEAPGSEVIVCPRCRCKNWDPIAAATHARWCDASPVGLVGENRELDQLLLDVATVGRPTDAEPAIQHQVERLTRADLLRRGVAEAGRHLLARLLWEERRSASVLRRLSPETVEAIQALRDAADAQSRAGRSAK